MKVAFRLVAIAAIAIFTLGVTQDTQALNLPECALTDCNCSDFATEPEAQAVFDLFKEDLFNLDRNNDGIVCTSLPSISKDTATTKETTKPEIAKVQPRPASKLALRQIKFGNPSNANYNDRNNYLIPKDQFVISYNCSKNLANWVSWTVNANYMGDVKRKNDFHPDPDVPCYQVTPKDYQRSGYDRGHIAPSADRDSNAEDNSTTFSMSNMMPQSPSNNRGVWRGLESFERDLIGELGDEAVYIVAGPLSNIGTIGNGVTIPKSTHGLAVRPSAHIEAKQVGSFSIANNAIETVPDVAPIQIVFYSHAVENC